MDTSRMSDTITCSTCKQIKPLTEYYKRNDAPGQYYKRCRTCSQMKNRLAWAAEHVVLCEICGEALSNGYRKYHPWCKAAKVTRKVDWDCRPNKCRFHAACTSAMAVNKGAQLPCCTMEAVPVVTWDVTSEFDRLTLGAWVEVER